jgi:HK97 gp10 family phage protein
MLSIDFDTSKLMQSLTQLTTDIQQHAIRSAAYAASQIIYTEINIRVPVGSTGNLKASLYQYHDTKLSVNGKHIYSIGPNKKKAPHWHLVEYGTSRMAARPFIRPTYDAKIDEAMRAAVARLHEKVRELSNA